MQQCHYFHPLAKNKGLYNQMVNTGKALIAITKAKLEPKIHAQLSNMFIGIPKRTFQAFYQRHTTKYGRPSPHDISKDIMDTTVAPTKTKTMPKDSNNGWGLQLSINMCTNNHTHRDSKTNKPTPTR
jgi:hypothetical protein